MPKAAKSPAPPAAAPAVPDYEVKLFLDPAKVLGVDLKPSREADRVLNLKRPGRKIVMQFLDAARASPGELPPLHADGWNVRLRRFADAGEVELSYKRRYRVEPGGLSAALAVAAGDGFTAGEKDYAPQVEWGYARQRLTLTRKKALSARGLPEGELPSLPDARAGVVRGLPGKLDRHREAGWARRLLTDGAAYGPVPGKRYRGEWQGPDLDLEVWLVRAEAGPQVEPVVELSFKAADGADAAGFRDKLTEYVRDQGWLLDRDVLKTEMILKRY